MKVVVILSGGVDSSVLLYDVVSTKNEVYALSFDYGQKHKKEIECAKETCKKLKVPHKIIDLKVLGEVAPSALTRKEWNIPEGDYNKENMSQTVVPNRNMCMLSLATAFAIGIKANYLYYGAHGGDHELYFDCRPAFVEAMKEVIALADQHTVELKVPYLHMSKVDIVNRGTNLGVDFKNTWSCYEGKEKACGKCGTCKERLGAFLDLGLSDPIEYE